MIKNIIFNDNLEKEMIKFRCILITASAVLCD